MIKNNISSFMLIFTDLCRASNSGPSRLTQTGPVMIKSWRNGSLAVWLSPLSRPFSTHVSCLKLVFWAPELIWGPWRHWDPSLWTASLGSAWHGHPVSGCLLVTRLTAVSPCGSGGVSEPEESFAWCSLTSTWIDVHSRAPGPCQQHPLSLLFSGDTSL